MAATKAAAAASDDDDDDEDSLSQGGSAAAADHPASLRPHYRLTMVVSLNMFVSRPEKQVF